MELKKATKEDVAAIAALEARCFPKLEAATEASVRDRVAVYPNHFLLLFDGTRLVSFVNGFVTDERNLTDEMYEKAGMHDTDPDYQCQGLAAKVLMAFIEQARKEGRKGLVLTCKKRLIHYYARFGFVDEGVSGSTHGNVVWHQMRLTFAV